MEEDSTPNQQSNNLYVPPPMNTSKKADDRVRWTFWSKSWWEQGFLGLGPPGS